jgi:hypothetical protein
MSVSTLQELRFLGHVLAPAACPILKPNLFLLVVEGKWRQAVSVLPLCRLSLPLIALSIPGDHMLFPQVKEVTGGGQSP